MTFISHCYILNSFLYSTSPVQLYTIESSGLKIFSQSSLKPTLAFSNSNPHFYSLSQSPKKGKALLIALSLLPPLFQQLNRPLPSLLPHGYKDPKPRRQLQKRPREHEAVLQVFPRPRVSALDVGAAQPAPRARRCGAGAEHAVRLEEVGVAGKDEEEDEANRRNRGPVGGADLGGQGDGCQVANAEKDEDEAEEGGRGGGRIERGCVRLYIIVRLSVFRVLCRSEWGNWRPRAAYKPHGFAEDEDNILLDDGARRGQ